MRQPRNTQPVRRFEIEVTAGGDTKMTTIEGRSWYNAKKTARREFLHAYPDSSATITIRKVSETVVPVAKD